MARFCLLECCVLIACTDQNMYIHVDVSGVFYFVFKNWFYNFSLRKRNKSLREEKKETSIIINSKHSEWKEREENRIHFEATKFIYCFFFIHCFCAYLLETQLVNLKTFNAATQPNYMYVLYKYIFLQFANFSRISQKSSLYSFCFMVFSSIFLLLLSLLSFDFIKVSIQNFFFIEMISLWFSKNASYTEKLWTLDSTHGVYSHGCWFFVVETLKSD